MHFQKHRILVVEDEATDRYIIKKALAGTGIEHDLTFATNISEGIAATNGKEYDCIFLDYKLPGGTGLELLKAIRASDKTSPIIIVTSQEDVKIAVDAMKEGADDYITKDIISKDSGIGQCLRWAISKKEQVTRSQELESKLRETQIQLSTVAKNAPVILFTLNANGQFVFIEGKGFNSLGIAKDQILNHTIDLLDELPFTTEHYHRALQGEEFTIISEWHDFYFEIYYSPIRAENNIHGVLGVASDITAHKLAERNLEKARQLAEETAKIKEQFLANMSHEIRTPMNGIIGLARILSNTKLDTEQARYLHAIRNCSDNLLVIINDILDFSKIEAGKMNFETVEFSIDEVAGQTIELFQSKADEKSLQLIFEKDPVIPQTVNGDPTRLSQILNNLVSNAIKFTESGEVRIRIRLAGRKAEKVTIQFEVRDTGIGIPEKILPTIFDSFTQASSDTTRKFGGTGLGLTIVKRLIELQSGDIQVKSKHGSGTTFQFELPFTVSEVHKLRFDEPIENVSISHLRILLAEDNKVNQLVAKKVFSDWSTHLDMADNGLIALEKLRNSHYDLILMDIQMPEMDGYTAVSIIRNEFPDGKKQIPILAMTAHATASERTKIIESGMNDYINKPFDPDDLKKKILQLTKQVQSSLKDTHLPQTTATVDLKDVSDTNPYGSAQGTNASQNISHDADGRSYSTGQNPKINLSYLKRISDGNDTFVIEMIEMFLNKTPQALEQMTDCYQNHRWEELGQIAHRIKPSFAYVGLQDLQTTLAMIESWANEKGDKKVVNDLLIQVKSGTDNAFEQLRRELVTMK
jgi:PAS domain S-box-containing protein